MSKLLAIIDDYKDRHGQPSDASIARAISIKPQTISSWRHRGIKELPAQVTLLNLAAFIRVQYVDVLVAALIDSEYLTEAQAAPLLRKEGGGEHGRSATM